MTDEPTFVLPFHGVEDFPPESAPLAVKSAQATSNGLIAPVMFGLRTSQVALAVLLDIVANQRLALSPDQTQGTRPSSQGD